MFDFSGAGGCADGEDVSCSRWSGSGVGGRSGSFPCLLWQSGVTVASSVLLLMDVAGWKSDFFGCTSIRCDAKVLNLGDILGFSRLGADFREMATANRLQMAGSRVAMTLLLGSPEAEHSSQGQRPIASRDATVCVTLCPILSGDTLWCLNVGETSSTQQIGHRR